MKNLTRITFNALARMIWSLSVLISGGIVRREVWESD